MYKIKLINMPFAKLQMPSLGLTQLKYVLESAFTERVTVDVLYLNQDFGHFLGLKLYNRITLGEDSQNSGMGDWLFRQLAFPELEDNTEEYLRRYFPLQSERTQKFLHAVMEKRKGLDAFLDSLIEKYRLAEADLAGFTTMFMQSAASFAMARKLKERRPEMITVLGGANCESPMGGELVQHVPQLDFVFAGPALKSLPLFVQHQLDGKPERCHRINGVFSRRNSTEQAPLSILGQCSTVAVRGDELDINEPVKLDYRPFLKTFNQNFPGRRIEPNLTFETSRGCWWGERAHCTFCGLNAETMPYRAMKPENALKQFEALFEYADECSFFDCVDNILPKEYLNEVLPHLKTPPNVNIFYEVKADLTERDVQVLAQARVKHIQPGIEALNTSTLKLMKKGTTAFHNLNLLKLCATYDVTPDWNLLVGFPGEEEAVYEKYVRDLPSLIHLPPPSGVFPVRFDRFSPYHMQAEAYGLDLHPCDFYRLIYPFSDETLAKTAYYFTDHNFKAPYIMTTAQWLGRMREKTDMWIERWAVAPSERPQLRFVEKNEGTLVFDSRGERPVEHQLSAASLRVLEHLSKPNTVKSVSAVIPDADAEQEVAALYERGLLFQEANRYMSLVLPSRPATTGDNQDGSLHQPSE